MNLQQSLVTIAPRKVLGLVAANVSIRRMPKDRWEAYPDVLVGVLDALFQRRQVRPVLPVLIPENVCVDASADKGGNADAV